MINYLKPGLSILILMIFPVAHSQETDLSTKIEYHYFPQSNSDNSFRRLRARANYPIKLGERSFLLPGLEYRNVELQYIDSAPFRVKELDRFQSFTARLTYSFGMKKDWRFVARFGVNAASNFERSDILREDITFEGAVAFVKDRSEEEVEYPWRLVLGIIYDTKSGRPFPLPIVNYFKTINDTWSYTAGVPKSNLIYSFNESNTLQVFAELAGFYANIQEDIPINGNDKVADDITMTVVLSGLGYEHFFTEHLLIFLDAGYTILNDIRLRNEDKDDIYTINEKNSFYGQIGVEFRL